MTEIREPYYVYQPMPPARIWKAVLQCHACTRIFTLTGLLTDQINDLQSTRICPHCAARPIVVPGPPSNSKLHRLIDLREEPRKNNH
ncbi:MAG TPA: hypothetical protein VGL70_19620 [Candidatus Binatia bacterium]